MPSPALRLAVIESRWWENSNTSVRGIFDLLSDLYEDHMHGYHYEMFGSAPAFEELVARIGLKRRMDYLYVATHGTRRGIKCANGDVVPLKRLRDMLLDVKLSGLYLGACDVGTEAFARQLLGKGGADTTPLAWVAGYCKKVEWLQSSALDFLFWSRFWTIRRDGRRNPGNDKALIIKTAHDFQKIAGGLAEDLGFEIFVRQGPEVVPLLAMLRANQLRRMTD
jgi:hypothetical protein